MGPWNVCLEIAQVCRAKHTAKNSVLTVCFCTMSDNAASLLTTARRGGGDEGATVPTEPNIPSLKGEEICQCLNQPWLPRLEASERNGDTAGRLQRWTQGSGVQRWVQEAEVAALMAQDPKIARA